MGTIRLGPYLSDVWLPAIRTRVRPSTLSSYRSHIENQLEPRLGQLTLDRLGPERLNAFYADLLEDGRADGTGGLSPATVRRVHAALHRALADAVRWGYLADNPADRCDPPRIRIGDNEIRTWTGEEVAAFLRSIAGHDLYPLFLLLVTTGLRRGEALGLRWSDIDLERSELAVRRTVLSVSGKIISGTPKTAKGRRTVALDDHSVTVLKAMRSTDPRPDGLAFGHNGAPLDPVAVSKTFARLVKRSGLPSIRLHDLRHTHATLALRAGVHPKIVSERLGHATISLTLDVYSHAIPHMQVGAADKVASLIFGP